MLNKLQLINLEKYTKKLLGENFDKFDFQSEVDSSLTYYENKRILKEKIASFFTIENDKIRAKAKNEEEMIQALNNQARKKEEEQAELEFMKSLEKIEQDKSSKTIEEIYFMPKNFAKMVARKQVNGLILYGSCGLGKSYSVLRAFKEEKADFIYATGFSSPLELYQFLYHHKDKHIIFDDVRILSNPINLDLLKACLYSLKDSRIISWNSTSPRLKVPSKFLFSGTITILLNQIGKNEDLRAVEDRVLTYELRLSYEEIIRVLFELAKLPYKSLNSQERVEIVKWIQENSSEASVGLNLRFLYKCYEFFLYDKEKWEEMASKLLLTDEKLKLVIDLLKRYDSVKEACQEFIELGYSRATFFRLKQKVSKISP